MKAWVKKEAFLKYTKSGMLKSWALNNFNDNNMYLSKVSEVNAPVLQIKIIDDSLIRNYYLDAAKKSYIDIMRLYNNLNPEDQAKVYNDVRELYFERKNAEELKA